MFDGPSVISKARAEIRVAAASGVLNICLWALLLLLLPTQAQPQPPRLPSEPPAKFGPCFWVSPYTLLGRGVSEPDLYFWVGRWSDSLVARSLLTLPTLFLGFNYPAILAAREPATGPCSVSSLSPVVLLTVSTIQWCLAGGLACWLVTVWRTRGGQAA